MRFPKEDDIVLSRHRPFQGEGLLVLGLGQDGKRMGRPSLLCPAIMDPPRAKNGQGAYPPAHGAPPWRATGSRRLAGLLGHQGSGPFSCHAATTSVQP